MKFFAISDIHGCADEFHEMLNNWNADNEQLVLMGDYIDRGKDSLRVLQMAKRLKDQYGAIVLGGNHEDLLMSFLQDPKEQRMLFMQNGGDKTIASMLHAEALHYNAFDIARLTKEKNIELIEFIMGMRDYYETNRHIFVHAGVNLHLKDWTFSTHNDYRWIRHQFHATTNKTGKTIVFGHTPTSMLNEDKSDNVWFSKCNSKIGIDGGCVFGGRLNGIKINERDKSSIYEVFAVR